MSALAPGLLPIAPAIMAFVGYMVLAVVGLACRWRRRVLTHAVTLSIGIQATAVVWALAATVPVGTILGLVGIVMGIGFAVEWCGVAFSIPFGGYRYTKALTPQVGGVPIQIVGAWWATSLPAFAITLSITTHPWARILIGAQLVAALDLFIDPTFVHLKFWQWDKKGGVFGIPLVNYGGWALTAAVMVICIHLGTPLFTAAAHPALILIYAINVVLQSMASLFLWPWRERRILLVAVPLLWWPLVVVFVRMI